MVSMDRAAANCCNCIAQFCRFVQSIGMHCHRHIHLLGYRKTAVNNTGKSCQVFMNFQSTSASLYTLHQALRTATASPCQETDIDRNILECLEHTLQEEIRIDSHIPHWPCIHCYKGGNAR